MMDFGTAAEPETAGRPKLKIKKEVFLSLFCALIIGLMLTLVFLRGQNPLPASIKNQISYKAVYPSSNKTKIDPSSYQYQSSQNTLKFTAAYQDSRIVFVEQPAPASLGSGDQVSFQAIGLHPYAQLQSKIGPVALANFYQSGNFQPAGQSAVLVSQGTLVIITSSKNLTNAQWKDLINYLKISR